MCGKKQPSVPTSMQISSAAQSHGDGSPVVPTVPPSELDDSASALDELPCPLAPSVAPPSSIDDDEVAALDDDESEPALASELPSPPLGPHAASAIIDHRQGTR